MCCVHLGHVQEHYKLDMWANIIPKQTIMEDVDLGSMDDWNTNPWPRPWDIFQLRVQSHPQNTNNLVEEKLHQ